MRFIALGSLLLPMFLEAATWNITGNGNWNVNANWTPMTFPNGVDSVALFSNNTTAARTVTLGQDITVGSVTVDSSFAYTIASPTNFLIFDVSTGAPALTINHTFANVAPIISSKVTLNDPLNITQNSTSNLTLSGIINGNSGINILGPGTTILSGANTYTGGTVVSGGILQGTNVGIQGAITNNSQVIFNQTTSGINSATISGTGSVTKQNTGNVTLSGTNTYSGGTFINQGTLTISSQSNLGDPTIPITFTGSSTLATSAAVTLANPVVVNTGAAGLISGSTTFQGQISGGGSLTAGGSAIAQIYLDNQTSSPNNYSGGTLVNFGNANSILQFYNGSQFGSGDVTYIKGGMTLVNPSAVSTTIPNNFVMNGGANTYTITLPSTSEVIFGGQISGSIATFAVRGGGMITLEGTNTFTTSVSTGIDLREGVTLRIMSDSNLGDTGNRVVFNGAANVIDYLRFSNNVSLSPNRVIFLHEVMSGIIADSGTTSSIAGQVQGNGSLSFSGGGTVALTNTANSFIGTTTIIGPTVLQIPDDAVLGLPSGSDPMFNAVIGDLFLQDNGVLETTANVTSTRTLVLTNSGTLRVDPSVTTNWNGSITDTDGTSALNVDGAGTLILNAANSYGGGTVVSNGILQGNATSLQGNITNHSSVVFDQAAAGTYAGNISGNGSVTKQNTGTLTLTGANNYSGGTIVTGGALEGNTSSLQGNITNSGAVIFNQSSDGTYSGNITGGALTKTGSNVLTLTGNNQTLSLIVQEGTLEVNSPLLVSSGIEVQPSGLLEGMGPITGDITAFGSIAPGSFETSLNVVGNVDFHSGSSYVGKINGDLATLLNVNGQVTIDSGAKVAFTELESVIYTDETKKIISTTTGLNGTFSAVELNFPSPPLLSATILYTDFDALLQVEYASFASLVSQGNAGRVASYLDLQTPPPGSDLSNVIFSIETLMTEQEIKSALNQLQPSLFSAIAISEENMITRTREILSDRIRILDFMPCLCVSRQTDSSKNFIDRMSELTVVPSDTAKKSPSLGIWVTMLGDFYEQNKTSTQPGFHTNSGSVSAGFDKKWNDTFLLGGMTGYAYSAIDWSKSKSHAHTQNYYAGSYFSYSACSFLTEASLMGGYVATKGDRTIDFIGVSRVAKHHQYGWFLDSHVGAAGNWKVKHVGFSPYGNLDYMIFYQDSFRETGADSIDLLVEKKKNDLLRAEIGLELFACFVGKKIKTIPAISLGGVREWRFKGRQTKAKMQGAEGYFTVNTLNPDRTLFTPGAELSIHQIEEKVIFKVRYEAEISSKSTDQNALIEIGANW